MFFSMFCPGPWGREWPFLLWGLNQEPGVAIFSCNDGLRSVIFKLEATEGEFTINYEPVR